MMNIETKLRQFDEMQRELNMLRERQNNENDFNSKVKPFLKSSGLLQQTGDGRYHVPGSWEEHQQMLKMQKEEENIAQQLHQASKQQLNFQPHEDRRKATNQLEAIQTYNDAKSTGLRESVVLLDHLDANQHHSLGDGNSQMAYS